MGPGLPHGPCWQRFQGFPAGPRTSCTARLSPGSEPPGAFHLWDQEHSRLDYWVTFYEGFKCPVAGSFPLHICSHFHKHSNEDRPLPPPKPPPLAHGAPIVYTFIRLNQPCISVTSESEGSTRCPLGLALAQVPFPITCGGSSGQTGLLAKASLTRPMFSPHLIP